MEYKEIDKTISKLQSLKEKITDLKRDIETIESSTQRYKYAIRFYDGRNGRQSGFDIPSTIGNQCIEQFCDYLKKTLKKYEDELDSIIVINQKF